VKLYLEQSERPLAAILLVTPLAAIYEIGTRGAFDAWLGTTTTLRADQLVAFDLLRRGFGQFGATASLLPAGLLVACLLGWHLARRDGWSVKPGVLIGMTVESLLLAVPIALLGVAMARAFPLAAGQGNDGVLLSIGAGLYEELLFRLLGFVVLHLVLADILRFPKWMSVGGTVLLSAAGFALYHCLGSEAFQWPAFVFRSVAGVVLGTIFLTRGFGITALSHVAYNLLLCAAAGCRGV
jgi:hypothetical protein